MIVRAERVKSFLLADSRRRASLVASNSPSMPEGVVHQFRFVDSKLRGFVLNLHKADESGASLRPVVYHPTRPPREWAAAQRLADRIFGAAP